MTRTSSDVGPVYLVAQTDEGDEPTHVFRVVIWLVSLETFVAFAFGLAELPLMWLSKATLLSTVEDLSAADLTYRVHFYLLGISAWVVLPPLFVQVRRPQRREAQMLQAWGGALMLAVVMAAAGAFTVVDAVLVAVVTLIAFLHPARSRITRRPRFDRRLGLLATVAALPAVIWAGWAVGEAWSNRDLPHVAETPVQVLWAHVALAPLLIVLAAGLGGTDYRGWRFSAWTASVASILVGAHSIAFGERAAALPPAAAIGAIAWGVAYGAVTIRRSLRSIELSAEAAGA